MYGAEAVILNTLRAMRGGPHDAAVGIFANNHRSNLQFHEAATREGFFTNLIPCNGQIDPSTIAVIRQLTAAQGANVVHAHGYKADIYCWLALRGRIPLVSTCHTWYDTDRLVTLYGKADRLVLRTYQRVIAVSDEVRQRLLNAGVRAERIRKVRNGIDLRPFAYPTNPLAVAKSAITVGLVGRLAWEKGVDVFLSAAALLKEQCPTAKFVVAGEGPDNEKLCRMIDD